MSRVNRIRRMVRRTAVAAACTAVIPVCAREALWQQVAAFDEGHGDISKRAKSHRIVVTSAVSIPSPLSRRSVTSSQRFLTSGQNHGSLGFTESFCGYQLVRAPVNSHFVRSQFHA